MYYIFLIYLTLNFLTISIFKLILYSITLLKYSFQSVFNSLSFSILLIKPDIYGCKYIKLHSARSVLVVAVAEVKRNPNDAGHVFKVFI